MTKQEFIKLFELEKIYEKYQSHIPFAFGLHDNLTGTENAIFYLFKENKVSIIIDCNDFNKDFKKQTLEMHLIFNEENIELNSNELFVNEIFPFLTFDTHLDAALKFVANFSNKILIPKYKLMGGVTMF